MLKNKFSVWKRIKFPTFWYNCYYFTWSDTYFIQLETLLINHPSYYVIFIIYYSSDSPSSLINVSLSVTQSLLHTRRVSRITVKALVTSNIIQSVCLAGKGRLKERCGLELPTNIFFRLRNRRKLVWMRFGCGLDSRIYGKCTVFSWFSYVVTNYAYDATSFSRLNITFDTIALVILCLPVFRCLNSFNFS